MAVPMSWQEGRNSIVTTVSRKTAHRRISFHIFAVSAPERHWIGFQSHFSRAAHATYSVGTVQSSGRTHIKIHTSARVAIQFSPPNLSERGSLRSPIITSFPESWNSYQSNSNAPANKEAMMKLVWRRRPFTNYTSAMKLGMKNLWTSGIKSQKMETLRMQPGRFSKVYLMTPTSTMTKKWNL